MITFFSSPRPFNDRHISIIQKNAIQSWMQLEDCEVLLIGDDKGVAEIAAEFNIAHFPEVKTTKAGIPWRDSMFALAREHARHRLLCFISSDIIIIDHFLERVRQVTFPEFVLTGFRFDMDITDPIDFTAPDWKSSLRTKLPDDGVLHGPAAVDYAVYPKELSPPILPPFPVNLPAWDGWFLYQFKSRHIPIINAGDSITVIHQNHNHRTQKGRKKNVWRKDAEAKRILNKAGGLSCLLTLRESDYILTQEGIIKAPFPYNILSQIALHKPYQKFLGFKRWVQQLLLR